MNELSKDEEIALLKFKLQEAKRKSDEKEGKFANASIRIYRKQNTHGEPSCVLGIFLKKKKGLEPKINPKNFSQYCICECELDSSSDDLITYINAIKNDLDEALREFLERGE